ncbi:HNH endonuclease (plasmid) [Pantoea ananatis]|uniref:HNH endonuclease n=2 Tax=Pantoea ananas TaxID=553 RepID=UPI0020796418|nr:HNH endonuclease signature motif containing protein [Pantoea ananatis]USL60465.1 HNH endonuclease [Pantoea ananatis]UYL04063.1 HNH endonuclease [Pantoea ananatis]
MQQIQSIIAVKPLKPEEKANLEVDTFKNRKNVRFEYTLPTFLEENHKSLLKISGFDKKLSLWHIERLPNVIIEGSLKLYICPYCGKKKTHESLRIDHIIPIKVYTKYKAYLASRRTAKNLISNTKALKEEILKHSVSVDVSLYNNIKIDFNKYKNERNEKLYSSEEYNGDLIDSDTEVKPLSLRKENINDKTMCWEELYYAAVFANERYTKLRNQKLPVETKYVDFFAKNNNLFRDETLNDLAKKAANNSKNLIACCHSCNSSKGGEFSKAKEYIDRGINYTLENPGLHLKLSRIKLIYESIDKLDDHLKEKIISEPIPNKHSEEIIKNLKKIQTDHVGNEKISAKKNDHIYMEKLYKYISQEMLFNSVGNIDRDERSGLKYSTKERKEKSKKITMTKDLLKNNHLSDVDTMSNEQSGNMQEEKPANFNPINQMFSRTENKIQKPPILPESSSNDELRLKNILSHELSTSEVNKYEGRVCFYCLGVYENECFEIDHINPSFKPNSQDERNTPTKKLHLIARNNFPLNLIPVCKTCNATKGKNTIDFRDVEGQLLDKLINKRITSTNRYGFVDTLLLNEELGKTSFIYAKDIRTNLFESAAKFNLCRSKLKDDEAFKELLSMIKK